MALNFVGPRPPPNGAPQNDSANVSLPHPEVASSLESDGSGTKSGRTGRGGGSAVQLG